MSDKERLADIKEIQNNATFIHNEGDPRMELDDEIRKFWEQEHTDWLIEKAEEINRLREALAFYADADTYTDDRQRTSRGELVHTGYTKIQGDYGERARKALEGTE